MKKRYLIDYYYTTKAARIGLSFYYAFHFPTMLKAILFGVIDHSKSYYFSMPGLNKDETIDWTSLGRNKADFVDQIVSMITAETEDFSAFELYFYGESKNEIIFEWSLG